MSVERFWLFEPHTGTRLQEVFPLSGSSEASCKAVGSATYQFHLGASGLDLTYAEARSAFRSVARGIVQGSEDGGVTWAGPIWARSWDETTEILTVRCREIRAILARRFWYFIGEYGTAASTIDLAGSLAQIIAHLLDFAFVRSRERWDIPLDRSTPAPGGTTHARRYERSKTTTIDRAISELEDMENGPDLYLEPAWGDNFSVKWIRRLGSPRLAGGTYDFDLSATESPIVAAGFEDDADNFTTGLLVTGDGMSDSRIIAQIVEADVPGKYAGYGGLFLDDMVSGDWDTIPKAFAHGKAMLTANSTPTEDMPLTVLDDYSAGSAKWWPGARVTARKPTSRFLPQQQRYVTGVKRRVGSPLVVLESVEA